MLQVCLQHLLDQLWTIQMSALYSHVLFYIVKKKACGVEPGNEAITMKFNDSDI